MRFNFIKFCAALLSAFIPGSSAAQTVALSDDPDFIHASIVVTATGVEPYQISGHAGIRMECPQHSLDRVFNFVNSAGNNFKRFFIDGVEGRVVELEANDYFDAFRKENRRITSYSLNLTLDEKARLWEALDSMKTVPPKPFRIIGKHCFSVMARAIDRAVAPSKINWDEPELQQNTYAENLGKAAGENFRWSYLLIMLTLGDMADTSGKGQSFVCPASFEMIHNDLEIVAPDGSRRPLITGLPEIVLPGVTANAPRPSPIEAALIILVIVIAVTAVQFFGKYRLPGTILDSCLWTIVIIGGILVVIITYSPHHYGGNWNWPLIVLNPVAWIPIIIFRKNKKRLKATWMAYAATLLLFALFIGTIAPSIDAAWRILATALAMRCAYNFLTA